METFKTEAVKLLQNLNYLQTENESWKLTRVVQMPGATITVNGQQMPVQMQTVEVSTYVEFFGPGSINPETDQEQPFEVVQVTVVKEKEQQFQEMYCFYGEDFKYYEEIITTLSK